jgi:hypothetical protein
MAGYTLGNTRTFFEELDRRIGDALPAEVSEDDIHAEWKRRHLALCNMEADLKSLPAMGQGLNSMIFDTEVSTGEKIARLSISSPLQGKRQETIEQLRASKVEGLRDDLSAGAVVAMLRLSDGFGNIIPASFWDGTAADKVMTTGKHNGHEVRFGFPLKAPNDGGERWMLNWLTANYVNLPAGENSRPKCLAAMRVEAKFPLQNEAFSRAVTTFKEQNPKAFKGGRPPGSIGKAKSKAKKTSKKGL